MATPPPPGDPPIRAMTRLLAELQTGIMHRALPIFAGDVERFGLFVLALRQSLSGRTISNSAMSASLGLPLETARRKINALIAAGFLKRDAQGLVADRDGRGGREVQALLRFAHDAFVRFLEDLDACGGLPRFAPSGQTYEWQTGVQFLSDLMLAVAATNRGTHADWTNLVIFSTVLCANNRAITADPVLAQRYASPALAPPRDLIHPVSARVVARVLAIPRTTVARRIAQQAGVIERVRGGLVISEEWLARQNSLATSQDSYANLRRLLAGLAQRGFPFHAIASAYLDGRPAPVDFDEH